MFAIDWLSHLLNMLAVTGRFEDRHAYSAPWHVAFEQSLPHEIPYQVVLQGRVIVEDPEMLTTRELVSGDIVLWPHGTAHVMRDGDRHLPKRTYRNPDFAQRVLDADGQAIEPIHILCGRFLVGLPHNRLIRHYLPRCLVVRALGRPVEAGARSASNRLACLVELMSMESASAEPGGRAILNDLSSGLFTLVLRAAANESENAPVGLLALANDSRLAPAVSAMFTEPARPWNPLDLADLCNMSRTTFMRHFRDRAGHSAVELLIDIRMSLAANELKKPAVTIRSVADSIGYRSLAAFRRAFAIRMGMTPGQWQNGVTEEPRTKRANKPGTALC